MKDWYAPSEIKFRKEHVLFLIEHIDLLRSGQWPPECKNTGYIGTNSQKSFHAPFETPALFAAEIDYRLGRCGLAGQLLEAKVKAQYLWLEREANQALMYCCGWKRRDRSFADWKKDRNYHLKKR